jgi:hypothetical protein
MGHSAPSNPVAIALSKYPVTGWKVVKGAAIWDDGTYCGSGTDWKKVPHHAPCYKVPRDVTLELRASEEKIIRLITWYDYDEGWMRGDDYLEVNGQRHQAVLRHEVHAYVRWLIVQPLIWHQLVQRCDEDRVTRAKAERDAQAFEDSLEQDRQGRLREDL